MNEPVATVEPNRDNADKTPRPSDAPPAAPPPQAAARFTYASGSQPLAGYTIRRGLGHGGFGEVYYATSDAGKEVALKLIRRNLEVELRGIRHCLNLKHPNLLLIYDIREDGQGDKWVVMEYVTGQRLEEAIVAHPAGMAPDEAMAWLNGIGAGVAYLHDHGIVHRDLKPGNIFSEEGLVKVGDYGLSKFISCSRRSGQTESVGTVHYMAPEVANGRYGKEIDIYALGVILFEMLTGHVPFEGESVGEVLMKHLTAVPDVSSLAEPFRSVVARAMEKDPARRFGSVGEMLAALPRGGKGDSPHLPGPTSGQCPPDGCFAQMGPVPFSAFSPDPANAPTSAGAKQAQTPEPPPVVEVVDEEPIYAAVRRACRNVHKNWEESNLHASTKLVLIILILLVAASSAHTWGGLAILLLVIYGCYRMVRAIVRSIAGTRSCDQTGGRRSPFATHHAHPAAETPGTGQTVGQQVGADPFSPRRRTARWVQRESALLAALAQSPRRRLAGLLGSLVGSALVAFTMCLVLAILESFHGPAPTPAQFAWLVVVSVTGAWAVLVPSKFWEGGRCEPMLRRFVLMVIGLAVGLVSFATAVHLKVDLPHDRGFGEVGYNLPAAFYGPDGSPLLAAHAAALGTLFLFMRWWRQTDPLRSTRLSVWAMIVSSLAAWLVAGLWLFPQPWLAMVACAMSAAVQLAGRWLSPHERVPSPGDK
jgi:serine/threonine protein kinase